MTPLAAGITGAALWAVITGITRAVRRHRRASAARAEYQRLIASMRRHPSARALCQHEQVNR